MTVAAHPPNECSDPSTCPAHAEAWWSRNSDPCPLHPDQPRPCAPCGLARVRAAIRTRPATQPTDPNPTRARALARARHERTTR